MNILLTEVGDSVSNMRCLLFVDNATWVSSKDRDDERVRLFVFLIGGRMSSCDLSFKNKINKISFIFQNKRLMIENT